jgi:hypothetical protein
MGTGIILHGHVNSRPTFTFADGECVARAQVVTEAHYPSPHGEPGLQIDHHRVVAYDKPARVLASLRPGQPVILLGLLELTVPETPRTHLEIEVLALSIEPVAQLEPSNRALLSGKVLEAPRELEGDAPNGIYFSLALETSHVGRDGALVPWTAHLWVYAFDELADTLRTTWRGASLRLRGHLCSRVQNAFADEMPKVEMVATELVADGE